MHHHPAPATPANPVMCASTRPPQCVQLAHAGQQLPLHNTAATRRLEQQHLWLLPPHALMQRAGLAVARLALALAPHARTIWIACGPGNNGGDGLQAAAILQGWGKQAVVSLLAEPAQLPADAAAAHQLALQAGVGWSTHAPALSAQDLCIDALLGIGASRKPSPAMCVTIAAMHQSGAPILAVDMPTGLQADTGTWAAGSSAAECVHAQHTLTLLTLKPGLFTGHGRDCAGTVWWHDLGTGDSATPPAHDATAWLYGTALHTISAPAERLQHSQPSATLPPHASHKGSFGNVCIVGGAEGMAGAAVLAGSAALRAGAGRVYVGMLGEGRPDTPPELMVRHASDTEELSMLPLADSTTAAGCGGGDAIGSRLAYLLQHCPRLLLDADALNALAQDGCLRQTLRGRASQGLTSILTPHPLEAARLLGCSASSVQADRLAAAQRLADTCCAIVVLKGSGTLVAMPGCLGTDLTALPALHLAGNARLATAGTGDVLAGCMAAYWEHAWQQGKDPQPPHCPAAAWSMAFHAACAAVHAHGMVASQWGTGNQPPLPTLTAANLASALPRHRAQLSV